MHLNRELSAAKGVLVVCDGNTCRSPTLAMFLRYRARLLGLANFLQIESAGFGKNAANGDSMPAVAQHAATQAAPLLNLGQQPTPTTSDLVSTLRDEAIQHRSRQVAVDAETLRPWTVVCLLTRKAESKLDPKGTLRGINSVVWLPLGDNGFRVLELHGRNESHPDVAEAYRVQAEKLAGFVTGRLSGVFEGLRVSAA